MARILVVDDNADMLVTLEHLFQFYDFEVLTAANGREGVEAAQSGNPDLIILDALMPVMNGFEACEHLKRNPVTRNIPVIFLSANYTSDQYREKGLDLGADDYVLKPFNAKDLIAKINSLLHRRQLIDTLRSDNTSRLRQVDAAPEAGGAVDPAAMTDALTGLFNGDLFQLRLADACARSGSAGSHFCLALLDVDLFHRVNEVYGEHSGDYVLMKVANVILVNSRPTDAVFRLEQNRFAILQHQASEGDSVRATEAICTAVASTTFFDQDFFALKRMPPRRRQTLTHLTVSAGIADGGEGEDAGALLQRAEEALSRAKQGGRNSAVRYSQLMSEAQ